MGRYANLFVGNLHAQKIFGGTVAGGLGKKLDIDGLVAAGLKETRVPFSSYPLCAAKDGAGAATGNTGDVNVMVADGEAFEYHIKGTQTIVSPVFVGGSGLNIGMDQTDNDGVEVTQGISSLSKSAFTVGVDEAFFFRATLKIEDVSGTDDLAIGFRKAEAYQANIDDYDEMAALNVISGAINIETILNGAATDTKDTTDTVANEGEVTLEVRVSRTGVVTFLINDDAPTATADFTFDDGEVVVPFLFFLNAADIAGYVYLTDWECGYQDFNN